MVGDVGHQLHQITTLTWRISCARRDRRRVRCRGPEHDCVPDLLHFALDAACVWFALLFARVRVPVAHYYNCHSPFTGEGAGAVACTCTGEGAGAVGLGSSAI